MKRTWLPRLAKGEILMAFGVTEPTAGSDTSRITTRAAKIDGGWLVNGQKVWTTNGQHAQRILLLARTAPRVDEQPLDGMTLFFTDLDRSRITVRAIEKLGRAAVDSNELFIDNLEVPDDDVVGEPGQGFRYLLDGLNPERTVVGMEGVGIGRAALDLATRYAGERVVFDRPIGKNQAIAHPLADAWIRLEAAELMAMKAAALLRRRAAVRQGVERRQVPRRRGGLPGVRPGDADPRRLRLREGVPRRAAVAGGAAAAAGPRLPGDGAQLHFHLRARPAEVVLTRQVVLKRR